jgi:zinc transport system substrate-binding protein
MSRIRKDRLALVIVVIIIIGTVLGYLAVDRISTQNGVNPVNAGDKIGVIVSIAPEVEFVRAVGGDKVDVTLMVPSTADVHTYEPLPSQLSKVAGAQIYVMLGSGLEFENNYMDKLISSNPNILIVNSSKGIQLIPSSEGSETENHHENGIYDPHIWTSPRNAKTMVNNIYEGLVEVDPENQEYYQKNRDEYLKKLDELDRNTTELLKDKTRPILIFHPAFGYYARDYNLTMIGVMVNDEEPSPQRIAMMVDTAQENNITVVYVEPQYDPKYMDAIASQIGGQVLFVSDLDENYLENMQKVAIAFSKS